MTKHMPLLGFAGGPVLNHTPAMQEKPFQSQGWEDPLKKEKVTHFDILTWEIL